MILGGLNTETRSFVNRYPQPLESTLWLLHSRKDTYCFKVNNCTACNAARRSLVIVSVRTIITRVHAHDLADGYVDPVVCLSSKSA